jgi:hypothetical protein
MPEWGPAGGDIPGSDSGPWIDWDSIANIPTPLKKLASAPVSFILGALLSVLLGGLEAILQAFVDAVLAIFDAVAYIPRVGSYIVANAAGGAGNIVLNALNGLFESLAMAAAYAGPGAPLLLAVIVAGVIITAAYLARIVWTLLVDSVNPL